MNIEKVEIEIREQLKVLGVKDWLKYFFIMCIPIINIIMWIKWVISDKTNLNLKNFLIASLIMMLIGTLIYGIFFTIIIYFMATIPTIH